MTKVGNDSAINLFAKKIDNSYLCKKQINMAMTIKTSPELRGEDAKLFIEEADRNADLPTPILSDSQRKKLSKMLESAKNIVFPPRKC